jgi:hypothetical protein
VGWGDLITTGTIGIFVSYFINAAGKFGLTYG